jgi:hypothetical protein
MCTFTHSHDEIQVLLGLYTHVVSWTMRMRGVGEFHNARSLRESIVETGVASPFSAVRE